MGSILVENIDLRIGVTAHRNLDCADTALLTRQVRELFLSLRARFPDLPLVVINPLATGGDTLVARVAQELGIPLEIPLPMPMEQYERDFTDDRQLMEFREICDANTVFELPLADGNSLADIAGHGPARNLQYAQMGMYIASHSHLLLALWDGLPSSAPGGTASVVHYQLHDSMPGAPEVAAKPYLLAEKESDLVFHIHCPRERGAHQREAGRWMTSDAEYPGLELPDNHALAFEHMQTFRRDSIRFTDEIEAHGDSLIADPAMEGQPALVEIDRLYRCADWLGVRYRKLVVNELLATHALAILMGFCFILYSEYTQFYFLLPSFLMCFFAAWLLSRMGNRMEWHRKYLDHRALAEGLRVQFYWTLSDIEELRGTAYCYDNLMQKQDVELVWIRHVMRGVGGARVKYGGQVKKGMALAIEYWIGEETAGSGQLGYYQMASRARIEKVRRGQLFGRFILWLGISIAIFLLFMGATLSDTPMNILLILMGMLPLAAAIREAYAYKKADKELAKQYQFMHRLFGRAKKSLQANEDPDHQGQVLRSLGEACLEEHSEWILLHRERPLEHVGLHA